MTDVSDRSALATRLAALEARTARAEAQLELFALKGRYASLGDARYTRDGPKPRAELERLAGEIAALFTEDAVWEAGGALGTCVGREAIRARFAEPSLRFAWHFFVKPALEVDADGLRARGSWDVLALCTSLEGRALWMVGVEHDEYARVDGRWLHTRMRLDAKLMAPHERGWARSPG